MRFGNDDGGILPSGVQSQVKTFEEEVSEYLNGLATTDRNAADGQMYTIMQAATKDGEWRKIGDTNDRIMGRPTQAALAAILYKVGTARIRLVFYPYGGSSQSKGGRIIRSNAFEWFNEEPEGETIPLSKNLADSMLPSRDLTGPAMVDILGRHLKVEFDSRQIERESNERTMQGLLNRNEKIVDKVLQLASELVDRASSMMDAANNRMDEAHGTKMGAMRMETSAHLAERRAIAKVEDAGRMLQEAEEALEQGKTEGWQRFIMEFVNSEQGSKIVGPLLGRVLDVLDEKFFSPVDGKRNPNAKLGMTDLMKMMTELELSPEQTERALKMAQNYQEKK